MKIPHGVKMISFVVFLILFLFTSIVFAQENKKSKSLEEFSNIKIAATTDEITISWDKIKGAINYVIIDQYGKQVYEGKMHAFTDSKLNPDGYYSYYLTGLDKDGSMLTERVAITAKTKATDGNERGFSYFIATKDYVMLDWEPIENLKDNFKIVRNGLVLKETTETFFKDKNIEHGKEYSYSVEAIVSTQEKNEQGELVTFDKTVSYQTSINTANVNNSSDFTVQASEDGYYPEIKFKTFIRSSAVYDPQNFWWGDDCGNDESWFEGDNRSFSYSSTKYRTYQEINIDFYSKTYTYSEDAGTSHGWCKKESDGTTYNHQYDSADMAESYINNVKFSGDSSVSFFLNLEENNPLVSGSPTIDAEIQFTVYRGNGVSTGSTSFTINHDGFPDYELYRKDGTLSVKSLYLWDANAHNDGILSLAWPMEHSATVTK